MNSALYRGVVTHSRLRPFRHSFRYRVYYGLFDVDELDALNASLRLFSVGRFNLLGFDPADHGPADGSSLRSWASGVLRSAGIDLDGGRIQVLAHLRVLGHVFDPISIWYCYGPAGELRGILHEVRNTFGHRHTYVVPIRGEADLRHRTRKRLHVSPFNDMDQEYGFVVNAPGRHLTVAIEQSQSGAVQFRAGLALRRLPLTDRNLLELFLTHPLVTLKTISAIHWQALRIWLKGGRYRAVPEPPSTDHTIVMSGTATP